MILHKFPPLPKLLLLPPPPLKLPPPLLPVSSVVLTTISIALDKDSLANTLTLAVMLLSHVSVSLVVSNVLIHQNHQMYQDSSVKIQERQRNKDGRMAARYDMSHMSHML